MSVVVDPSAPESLKERITGYYTSYKTILINTIGVAMLVYVVNGAPDWFTALTHTLVWMVIPLLALCVAIFLVISVVMSMNKDEMIAAKEEKARELSKTVGNLSNQLKPKPILGTISHLFTISEVVLLYMAGWTVAGAIYLILSVIFILQRKALRKQVQELAMAKLSRD